MITSVKDPRLAVVRGLATVAGRRAAGRCLLEGEALIAQAVEAGAELDVVIGTGDAEHTAATHHAATHHATPAVLRQALRTQKPVTALAVARLPEENPATDYGELAVVLDDIADPGNLGTILRTACGLGVTDVVFTDPDTDYTSRRVLESSRAAALRITPRRFATVTDALETLRAHGFQTVVTAPLGRTVAALAPLSGAPLAVVVGNETAGASAAATAAADHVVRIPMAGEVESLNVGVATGLALAQLHARAVLAGLDARCRAATFTPAVRAALADRLGGLDHLGAARFEELARAVANGSPVGAGERAELAALWGEYEHARRAHRQAPCHAREP